MQFSLYNKFAVWDQAAKRGILNEYIAICTDIQRCGDVIAETVNRAKHFL